VIPARGNPIEAIHPSVVNDALSSFIGEGNNYWSHIGEAQSDESSVTWFIGGTPPNWQAAPLAIAVLLEESNQAEVQRIGQRLLLEATNP
jgi:hypothetical protein